MGWSILVKEEKLWVEFLILKRYILLGRSLPEFSFLVVEVSILHTGETWVKWTCWNVGRWGWPRCAQCTMDSLFEEFQTNINAFYDFIPQNTHKIQNNPTQWDREKVIRWIDREKTENIIIIYLAQTHQENNIIWIPSNSSNFSAKFSCWTDHQNCFYDLGPFTKNDWKSPVVVEDLI